MRNQPSGTGSLLDRRMGRITTETVVGDDNRTGSGRTVRMSGVYSGIPRRAILEGERNPPDLGVPSTVTVNPATRGILGPRGGV